MAILPGDTLFGRPMLHKFGANFDIDTATVPEDIWSGGGVYTGFVAAAAATTIVSDSAADTSNGTGARTVTVFGLDANYLIISETATMNGATPVALTKQYLRVYRTFVATAGSGETNAGNITVLINAVVASHVAATFGQTLQATYTVPADYNGAAMLSWYIANNGTAVTTFVNVSLQTRSFGGAWQTKEYITINDSGFWNYTFLTPQIYAPKTDIRVRATAVGANNTGVSAGFDMVLGV